MKKMKKNNQITKSNSMELTPENVTSTIEGLKKKLEEKKKSSPKEVSLDIQYNNTNIKNITKISELLEISASINARNEAYNKEAKRYGIEGKVKAFKASEKSAEEWIEIIDKAIFDLINKTEIQQIENAIKKLSKFEDEKTQLQREFNSIVTSASELLS